MKAFLMAAMMLLFGAAQAQIHSADITASGLTCSMCSKAIYKSLSRVSGVQSIEADLDKSTYHVTFSSGRSVSPDALRKAVADAGFGVASLTLNADLARMEISSATPVLIEGAYYRFLVDGPQTIGGPQVIRIVDKGFVPAQEAKKYPAAAKSKDRVYSATL